MGFHASLKTQGFLQDIYQQSVDQQEELDTIRILKGGRMFAYARAGAIALLNAQLTQMAVPDSNANKETVAASAAIGATSVSVSFGGAVTADFYKDGYLWINSGVGLPCAYRVKGHPAGQTAVIVDLLDPVRVAITAGNGTASLLQNRQNLVVACPTTLTNAPAGVPPIAVDINYYFWNQVKGWCSVLTDGAVAIGEEVAPSNGTAGTVEALVHATTFDTTVGVVMGLVGNTEYSIINLSIPGY